MHLTLEERKLLQLTARETLIVKALEKAGGCSIQTLSIATSLPRTSLYWPLTQLAERNIVGYELIGKRKKWYSRMSELPLRKKLGSLKSTLGDVRVIEGTDQIRQLYMTALDLHPAERVLILEGNDAVFSIAQKVGIKFMQKWHALAHKKHIIIESIIGEKIYADLTKRLVHEDVIQSLALWETWIGFIVPDEWVQGNASVILFRDTAILTDWKEERSVLINTPDIVRQLKNLCNVFRLAGKKVDIVSHVRSIAAK